MPATKGRKNGRSSNAKQAEARVKWTPKKDECLAKAWKTNNINPIIGANQNVNTYWKRVKMAFDEHKMVDPEFSSIHIDRGEKAMANHWATIELAFNKCLGFRRRSLLARRATPTSSVRYGHSLLAHLFAVYVVNTCSSCVQMVLMFDMFRQDNNDLEFKFLHVFARITSCKKWTEVRLALAKTNDNVYNPDVSVSGAAKEHHDDNKRAKAARDPTPTSERLQSSIEHCIADARSQYTKREEKSKVRWSALMTKHDVKLGLLRTNVAVKNSNTGLTFLMGADMAMLNLQVKA
ncbi:putative methionyl-tRNA synthetase [Hordeum vulgare]|nr:putative methionyl-tRNA synthetase [Hordeum vulgare]